MRVAAFVLVIAGCHQPPPFTPVFGVPAVEDVRGDGVVFDCDASAGRLSVWSVPAGNSGRAQGSVFIASTRPDPEWTTLARVMLLDRDRRAHAGLVVKLGPRQRSLIPTVQYSANVAAKDFRLERLQPRNIGGISFEVEWNEKHARLRLEPNAPWLEIDLAFVPERFSLECSTGEAIFHNVSVDAAPPAAAPAQP